MSYIMWALVGILVAIAFGAGPRRKFARPNANTAFFAGVFGALIGGMLGDGVPHALAGVLTPLSLVGAAIGASIFCWALRSRAEDAEP